jgi:hypothetical protein
MPVVLTYLHYIICVSFIKCIEKIINVVKGNMISVLQYFIKGIKNCWISNELLNVCVVTYIPYAYAFSKFIEVLIVHFKTNQLKKIGFYKLTIFKSRNEKMLPTPSNRTIDFFVVFFLIVQKYKIWI